MKVLKIIAPIILALVIVLCLLFGFLSILRAPINIWHGSNQTQTLFESFLSYYRSPIVTALEYGSLPIVGTILSRTVAFDSLLWLWMTLFHTVCDCLIPATIIFISDRKSVV